MGISDGKSVDPRYGCNVGFAVEGAKVGDGVGLGDGALLGYADGRDVGADTVNHSDQQY